MSSCVKTPPVGQATGGYFEHGKETLIMQIPDGPSADSRAWTAAAGARSGDGVTDTCTQLQRLARLQQSAQRESAWGWHPLMGKFHDFLTAMTSAEAYKQPGVDGVVVEMVRSLSCPTLLWLYLLFLVRVGGWETET